MVLLGHCRSGKCSGWKRLYFFEGSLSLVGLVQISVQLSFSDIQLPSTAYIGIVRLADTRSLLGGVIVQRAGCCDRRRCG